MFQFSWPTTNFLLQRVMARFSVENILSHSAEKLRRGTLLCCVPEVFWNRRNLWRRRGGGLPGFPVEKICLTLPKVFVGDPFTFSLFSGIEKC